jgi:hypothetical protein
VSWISIGRSCVHLTYLKAWSCYVASHSSPQTFATVHNAEHDHAPTCIFHDQGPAVSRLWYVQQLILSLARPSLPSKDTHEGPDIPLTLPALYNWGHRYSQSSTMVVLQPGTNRGCWARQRIRYATSGHQTLCSAQRSCGWIATCELSLDLLLG